MYGPSKVSGLKWPKCRTPLPGDLNSWRDVMRGIFCGVSGLLPMDLGQKIRHVEKQDKLG